MSGKDGMRWLAVPALCAAACSATDDEAYRLEIERYRADRVERLRAEDGWLSLVGLFWLAPGETRFGADAAGEIVLEGEGVPPWAGTLHYDGATVRLEPAPETPLTIGGAPAEPRTLRDDSEGEPDVLRLAGLEMLVLRRGQGHAVRVKNKSSPTRTAFRGTEWFPIDPSYRIEGTFRAHAEPREVPIATVVGYEERMVIPGTVALSIGGQNVTLHPMRAESGENELFFLFKDGTSGHETYGAGRYLYATLDGDRVVVDFNRAYNPPCAFTPYATCPLPPRENWLDVRIEAGEKAYGGAH
jgi:uncharacterized protein (DUF1684 family)